MKALFSLILGYFIGNINGAAIMGRRKHVDLKQEGTGNLGATNTTMVLGWKSGALVMAFDIFKSFLSGKLAQMLFPQLRIAGMLACIGAMLGHCFPILLHFKGGKGLAAFGGLVIYYRLLFVPIILFSALALMFLLDCGVAFPLFVAAIFPVLVFAFHGTAAEVITAAAAGLLRVFGGPMLSPMSAGTAMALSSFSVVSNALRLRFFKV